MIEIDSSKQKSLDADRKAIKQINFTGNLAQEQGVTMFSIMEKMNGTLSNFSQGTVKVF